MPVSLTAQLHGCAAAGEEETHSLASERTIIFGDHAVFDDEQTRREGDVNGSAEIHAAAIDAG